MTTKLFDKNIKVTQVIKPQTLSDSNSSITSDLIDTQGFESLTLLVNIGTTGDTLNSTNFLEFAVQHNDDTVGSGFAYCANTDLSSTVSGTNSGTIIKVDSASKDELAYKGGYIGNKRYVRVLASESGTNTNGTPVSVTSVLGNAANRPVS